MDKAFTKEIFTAAATSYDRKIDQLAQMVRSLIQTPFINGLLVKGEPGIGKSFTINRVVKELQAAGVNVDVEVVRAHMTAQAMFETLKANAASNKLVIFDDCDSVLEDNDELNILKAACEMSQVRHIDWRSSRGSIRGSGAFDFMGKILILTNKIPMNAHTQAVKDRMTVWEMNINFEEKVAQCIRVARSDFKRMFPGNDFTDVIRWVTQNAYRIRPETMSVRFMMRLAQLKLALGMGDDPNAWIERAEHDYLLP